MLIHPAAELFPIDETTIPELADDIKRNGQRVPIEEFEGQLIDGRRRLKACELAGVKPWVRIIDTDDPVTYVLSLNLHRRHLSPTERAMLGAKAREIYDERAKERQRKHGETAPGKSKNTGGPASTSVTSKARDQAGKAVGVSGRTIDRATKVLKKGVPELVKAVDEGKLTVTQAEAIAKKPADEQREILSRPAPSVDDFDEPRKQPRRSDAMKLSKEAIYALGRIAKDDPKRADAIEAVCDWIEKNG